MNKLMTLLSAMVTVSVFGISVRMELNKYTERDIDSTLHRIEIQQKKFLYVDSCEGKTQGIVPYGSNLYVVNGGSVSNDTTTFFCPSKHRRWVEVDSNGRITDNLINIK